MITDYGDYGELASGVIMEQRHSGKDGFLMLRRFLKKSSHGIARTHALASLGAINVLLCGSLSLGMTPWSGEVYPDGMMVTYITVCAR